MPGKDVETKNDCAGHAPKSCTGKGDKNLPPLGGVAPLPAGVYVLMVLVVFPPLCILSLQLRSVLGYLLLMIAGLAEMWLLSAIFAKLTSEGGRNANKKGVGKAVERDLGSLFKKYGLTSRQVAMLVGTDEERLTDDFGPFALAGGGLHLPPRGLRLRRLHDVLRYMDKMRPRYLPEDRLRVLTTPLLPARDGARSGDESKTLASVVCRGMSTLPSPFRQLDYTSLVELAIEADERLE